MNDDFLQNALKLWGDPLFLQRFLEFYTSMQQLGLEAARRMWALNHREDALFANAAQLFEPLIAFYSSLGFVPKQQHDEVLKENERLKQENEVLKKTLRELNLRIFTEGSLQAQAIWNETAQKQIEISAEIAKSFLDLFKQSGGK
jgi:regulator of replication initiation timing